MEEFRTTDKQQFVERFRQRTKQLALDVILFSKDLPKTEEATIMKRQSFVQQHPWQLITGRPVGQDHPQSFTPN
jgi:hypothetical protein